MAPSPSPIYPVTLGVKSDGTLMASGDGKTEAVRDSLNLDGIAMTLRIEAACARDVAKLSATAATTAIASKSDADLLARVVETIAAELTGASR